MVNDIETLLPGYYYHVFNRAVGSDKFFHCEADYARFIGNWIHHVAPLTYTLAYCLIPNHFHFLVRMRSDDEICNALKIKQYDYKKVARKFANCFSSYAMATNYRIKRRGKLFMLPYKRKFVDSDSYFNQLIFYITCNALNHGLVDRVSDWKHSSYHDTLSKEPTWIHREAVLDWFGGREAFKSYHEFMIGMPN